MIQKVARFWLAMPLLASGLPLHADLPDGSLPTHRTPSFTTEGSAGCLRCHSGESMRVISQSPHGDTQNPQTPAALRGCESCHGAGSIHVSRAHGGRGFPPLTAFGRGADASAREEQLQACLGCHAQSASGRAPIAFFGSPHDRRTINCSTCHTVHAEVDPVSDRGHQAATCYRCHRRQRDEHPRFEDKGIEFDTLSCRTCHDVHAAPAELKP
jgi:DmsE family decaheme c-type cytochrome